MPTTEKCKTFGTGSANTKQAKQDQEQVTHGATANQEKTISLELGDFMAKMEQIDCEKILAKLKYCEEDHQDLKSEIRHNKNDNLDNCVNLQCDGREATADVRQGRGYRQRARETYQKDIEEMKKRYDTVNEKLWESRY